MRRKKEVKLTFWQKVKRFLFEGPDQPRYGFGAEPEYTPKPPKPVALKLRKKRRVRKMQVDTVSAARKALKNEVEAPLGSGETVNL